jgi:plastocyanin
LALGAIVVLSGVFSPTQALAAASTPGQAASGPTEAWCMTNHYGQCITNYGRGSSNYGNQYMGRNPYSNYGNQYMGRNPYSNYGNQYMGRNPYSNYGNQYMGRNPYSNYGNQYMARNPYSNNGNYGNSYGYNAPNYGSSYANPAPKPYGQAAPVPAPQGGQGMVSIQGFAFNPGTITVRVGQQVVWVNNDSAPHTTTSGSCSGGTCTPAPGWDSGTLNPGQSFSFTFTSAGTFTYFCRIHGASMQGTVVVTQ